MSSRHPGRGPALRRLLLPWRVGLDSGPASARTRRRAAWAALLLAAAAATAAGLARHSARQLAGAAPEPHAVAPAPPLPPAPATFLDRLPTAAPMADLLADVQRSCGAHGAQWSGFAATDRPGDAHHLARTEVVLTLRGSYSQIRAVVAAIASGAAAPVLRKLSIRRWGAPAELEAQTEWWLPVRPGHGPG